MISIGHSVSRNFSPLSGMITVSSELGMMANKLTSLSCLQFVFDDFDSLINCIAMIATKMRINCRVVGLRSNPPRARIMENKHSMGSWFKLQTSSEEEFILLLPNHSTDQGWRGFLNPGPCEARGIKPVSRCPLTHHRSVNECKSIFSSSPSYLIF